MPRFGLSLHLGLAATTFAVAAAAPGAQDNLPSCIEVGYLYSPNMDFQFRTLEATWEVCQTRCKSTIGCAYFSYWPDSGCHLQPAHAKRSRNDDWAKDSVISGPTSCDDSKRDDTHSADASSRNRSQKEEEEPSLCPGMFDVEGYGTVSLVPTGWMDTKNASAPPVKVRSDGALMPHMDARAYFADTCTSGSYDPAQYLALNLLGKKMRFSVDVSGAGCGCNAAFYLTSMRQNKHASECFDYYCDANNVCGESCAEIDLMEANQYSWHSTLHSAQDHGGVGAGFGGGGAQWNGPRDFTASEYGPGAQCVDTNKPFEVEVAFPVDGVDSLEAMEVTLSQADHSCPLKMRLGDYKGMAELSKALRAGMTPIVSYWSADDMLWLDGEGADHAGSCHNDDASKCGESVKIYGFSIESLTTSTDATEGASDDDGDHSAGGDDGASSDNGADVDDTLGNIEADDTRGKSEADDTHGNSEATISDPNPIIEVVPMPRLKVHLVKGMGSPASASPTSPASASTPSCSATRSEDCRHSRCCQEAGMQCYEKHEYWAACRSNCTPGLDSDLWTCKRLGSRIEGGSAEEEPRHHGGNLLAGLGEPAGDESDCDGCDGSTGLMFIRKHLRMAGIALPHSDRQTLGSAPLLAAGALVSATLAAAGVAVWRRMGSSRCGRAAPEVERIGLLDVELASVA